MHRNDDKLNNKLTVFNLAIVWLQSEIIEINLRYILELFNFIK